MLFPISYLPQFEACVKEGQVESVMGAYNRVNGEPACAHTYLMQEILRGLWGFEGHFVSDCWALRDFHENHRVTKTIEDSAALALNTGCDLNCGCTYLALEKAYKSGKVKEEKIRELQKRLEQISSEKNRLSVLIAKGCEPVSFRAKSLELDAEANNLRAELAQLQGDPAQVKAARALREQLAI
mgnify:CR=1 FL=1